MTKFLLALIAAASSRSRDLHLCRLHLTACFVGSIEWHSPQKLRAESGAKQIRSADDGYAFMTYMRLSYRNKPHWQMAKQALNHAGMSEASEFQAWRTFRTAARAEGWLED